MQCGKYFVQDLDTDIVVATAREPNRNSTAVSANLLVDDMQMNALFLDVVRCFLLCECLLV